MNHRKIIARSSGKNYILDKYRAPSNSISKKDDLKKVINNLNINLQMSSNNIEDKSIFKKKIEKLNLKFYIGLPCSSRE